VAPPVFINCRDRLTPLSRLVAWLEQAGCDEIYLLDNASTFEPLLEYYDHSPHTVLRLGQNYGKHALWEAPGVFDLTGHRRFVYTDPDVIPIEDCPLDAIDHFGSLLDRWSFNKVGFGLRYDDIPDHYRYKPEVLAIERGNWEWPVERGAYLAPIDTTFALYRPDAPARPHEAIRTGFPHLARHDSWYLDLDNLSEEELHYQQHAASDTGWSAETSHWAAAAMTEAHRRQASAATANRSKRFRRWTTQARWRLYGRRRFRLTA
jgi:hypothetical protein